LHPGRERCYLGEAAFKGEVRNGEQQIILDRDLFEAVQAKLDEPVNDNRRTYRKGQRELRTRAPSKRPQTPLRQSRLLSSIAQLLSPAEVGPLASCTIIRWSFSSSDLCRR